MQDHSPDFLHDNMAVLLPASGTAVPADVVEHLQTSLREEGAIIDQVWLDVRDVIKIIPGVTRLQADFPGGIPSDKGARPLIPSVHAGVPPLAVESKREWYHLEGWHKVCPLCSAQNSLAVTACRACSLSFDQSEEELNYEAHFQLLRNEAKMSIRFLHEANKRIRRRRAAQFAATLMGAQRALCRL